MVGTGVDPVTYRFSAPDPGVPLVVVAAMAGIVERVSAVVG